MAKPKKLIQTRMHTGMQPHERGNCFPAVIACIMGLDSAEDAIQVQELYDSGNWAWSLMQWLEERGWEWGSLNDHQYDGSFYLCSGNSPRGVSHVCIYQNGKLWHDPHPSGAGLLTEEFFEYLQPSKPKEDPNG